MHYEDRVKDPHDYSGMYDEGQIPDDRSVGRGYRDRDEPGYRSPLRGTSRSQSPTRDAGRPSDTVILEELPHILTAAELHDSVLRNSMASELPPIDVRIARGAHRAFVQFDSVDSAIAFTREHFPKLHLDLPQPTDEVPGGRFSAYLHYARSRDDVDAKTMVGQWPCSSCGFSNYSTRVKCKQCNTPHSVEADWRLSLTGQADAGESVSQILVIYPLPSFIDEAMLAADVKRLELESPAPKRDANGGPKLRSTAPTNNTTGVGARPGSLHRVFLMREVFNNESFKYGFAEFWTAEDAAKAVAKYQALRSFTVAACEVTVSTIHMGVFLPEERDVTPENEMMSFHPLFNPLLRVRYRDIRVYPNQLLVTDGPPEGAAGKGSGDDGDAKRSKKRKAEASKDGNVSKKPVVMAGQMAMWQRKHDELHQGKAGQTGNKAAAPETAKQDPDAPIKISLGGASIGGPAPKRTPSPEDTSIEPPREVSYVDRERLMCLICMRKYKSVDEVNIHEKSRNHKTATENEEQVKAALPRLAIRDKRLEKTESEHPAADTPAQETTEAAEYRDRAKQRRQAYSQPRKPATSQAAQAPKKEAPPQPAPSKGAGMLAKMGWTAGKGLGAAGEGRTDVIAQNAYQEGVGLGAEGSNLGDAAALAGRKTKGDYKSFVENVKDQARERYNKM
ncbi:putative RNA-binding protein-like protein [Emericellopsis cladophorae]|uniref:RNA-binding protein-like protein n=1 Tax=Emericellopsis cladophorae TaxID=2686198 RepID=A0A9P9Y373_9HYPO|nr:putative RNA-binding protein-like protein [Emericellopsis cladophorae]KAI6782536.1 putative RNA-binding protein-like protein [Emericellopsis cladophorae]